jgi:hypothetical protein
LKVACFSIANALGRELGVTEKKREFRIAGFQFPFSVPFVWPSVMPVTGYREDSAGFENT